MAQLSLASDASRPSRSAVPRLAVLIALGAAAFGSFQGTTGASASTCPPAFAKPFPRPSNPDGLDVDPPFDTREACPTWRWLGLRGPDRDSCPEPRAVDGVAWRVEPLFGTSVALPEVLRPYCIYALDGGAPIGIDDIAALNGEIEKLLESKALVGVESTCAAVAPMASDDDTWTTFRSAFQAEGGGLQPGVLARAASEAGATRLVLLDTEPGAPPTPPLPARRAEHGFALARMAHDLLYGPDDDIGAASCLGARPNRVCPVAIHQQLALPITRLNWEDPTASEADPVSGGYFGTVDQLAVALWETLQGWDAKAERLVVNMSIAWVGEHYGGLENRVEDMPLPVRALYRTLQVASCDGALVVAAAGNRVGGPDLESGPLLPGGWERRPAPSAEQCDTLRSKPVQTSHAGRRVDADSKGYAGGNPKPIYRPLVYAVAGVRSEGDALVNARPDSEPPRVAYGDHGISLGIRNGGLPQIMTGSSVATTVQAAAAAAAWAARPGLAAHEVMQLTRQAGRNMARRSEVHLPGPQRPVVRVDVCSSLRRAGARAVECRPAVGPAGLVPFCDGFVTAGPCGERPEAAPLVARFDYGSIKQAHDGLPLCRAASQNSVGTLPELPCPFAQRYSIKARPWTGPQPQNDPCLGCDIRPPPPTGGGSGFGGGFGAVEKATDSEPGDAGPRSEGCRDPAAFRRLHIWIDPEWKGGPLSHPTLDIGGHLTSLPLGTSFKAGDQAIVDCIPKELVLPTGGGRPDAALYFDTPDGSVESAVYIAADGGGTGGLQ